MSSSHEGQRWMNSVTATIKVLLRHLKIRIGTDYSVKICPCSCNKTTPTWCHIIDHAAALLKCKGFPKGSVASILLIFKLPLLSLVMLTKPEFVIYTWIPVTESLGLPDTHIWLRVLGWNLSRCKMSAEQRLLPRLWKCEDLVFWASRQHS